MLETGRPSPKDLGLDGREQKGREQLKGGALVETLAQYFQAPGQRLQAIAAELNSSFELGGRSDKEVQEAVAQRLGADGIGLSAQEYRVGKQLLRNLHLWLVADGEQAKKVIYDKVNGNERQAIDYFKAKGISNVDHLNVESVLPAVPAASENEVADDLEKANERLWARIRDLEETNSRLQDRLEELEDENDGLKASVSSSEDIGTTADLVKDYSRESQRERLAALLPKEFVWDRDRGAIKYADIFLRDLEGLEAKLQRRIIRQVELLSTNRMGNHNSLHTRKILINIPGVPQGWSSRGTHKHRFAWAKDGGITLHSIYQKGDSRVRESEG